ncbi:MAG: hypothetical protein ACRDPJ_04175, partial [Nocardioidaceae bacterium]
MLAGRLEDGQRVADAAIGDAGLRRDPAGQCLTAGVEPAASRDPARVRGLAGEYDGLDLLRLGHDGQ